MHPFDRDITFTPGRAGEYEGEISPAWLINDVANGGYLLALFAQTLGGQTDKPSLPVLTANYILRCTPGPARITTETMIASPKFDRFSASLFQEGTERVRVLATFREDSGERGYVRHEAGEPVVADRKECVEIPEMPSYSFYRHARVLLDPTCAGWLQGKELSPVSEQKGWFAFREKRPIDAAAVFLAMDAFPPAIMASHGALSWVPTLELSVNVRRLPKTPWLKCCFTTRHMDCGILEEDGQAWDEEGNLVALSRQVARFRV
ncbi:MAG: thioesterase family protein [Deltaproteobacteria bacterium]|nr:thioesterase family protein [Deltaproteobacteria bacterium]